MISVKGVASIAGIATLAAVSATMLASTANADGGTWAAVAYSASTDVKGFSWGYPIGSGPGSAVAQRAVQECANHPLRPNDCRWLQSARCVAVAQNSQYAQSGGGFTPEEAERAALALPQGVELNEEIPRTLIVCSEDGDAPGGVSLIRK